MCCSATLFLLSLTLAIPADDLTVVKDDATAGSTWMTDYLNGLVREACERRREHYESTSTLEEITAGQRKRREHFLNAIGGWPERTPLNASVTGHLAGDGFRVEKVIYQSRPGFHVTASFYLPLSDPPYPGVLVPCGHSEEGKAYESYQRACMLLARNGLAALCYDPIGQGERIQLLDEAGQTRFGAVKEHTLVGVGSILLGLNTASYRIWDGIRGIDYLVSRPEIDAGRIGCTGNSGGGTLTSYIMALDDRVKCAAPSCYLTSMESLCETIGPQDAEQNVFAMLAAGIDHADYAIMRAPKPTLICCATKDFFDIEGTWRVFREAKRVYGRMGFAERMDLVEANEKHGFSSLLRVGMVRWMRRWLLGCDDVVTEQDGPVFAASQLQCTSRGQVLLMDGARSVFDFNMALESELAAARLSRPPAHFRNGAPEIIRDTIVARTYDDTGPVRAEPAGIIDRRVYRVRKLMLNPSDGIPLPALMFESPDVSSGVCLYLNGQGKQVDAIPGGPIESLVMAKWKVLAVDLRGIGETETRSHYKGWAPLFGEGWQDFFRAYLLGRSYVGMRVEDIYSCIRFLRSDQPDLRVRLVARGEAGPPALHAVAMQPDLFHSLRLEHSLISWSNVVRTPVTRCQLINTVHGVLRNYDLPDLVKHLEDSGMDVEVVEPVDAASQPAR